LSLQPIPGTRFTFAKPGAGRSGVPYLALHPMGFSVPSRLRGTRCALTAPFHPCHAVARESKGGRFIFCGTVRRKVFQLPARVYPAAQARLRGIAPFGVRTFLLRLAPKAILRPSKTNDRLNRAAAFLKRQDCLPRCIDLNPPGLRSSDELSSASKPQGFELAAAGNRG
jgi:hypothetical protein